MIKQIFATLAITAALVGLALYFDDKKLSSLDQRFLS